MTLQQFKELIMTDKYIKEVSLCDLERMLRNRLYPKVRGARKLLQDVIKTKLMLLDDRGI